MTTALSPKLVAILARYLSTSFDGERDNARRLGAELAGRAGMSFEDALRLHKGTTPSDAKLASDWNKAPNTSRGAPEALMRRDAIIARYGSEAAVRKPTDKEAIILAATEPWRIENPETGRTQYFKRTFPSGTWRIVGQPIAATLDAIRLAYPMPTTYAEAAAEHDLWVARDADLAGLETLRDIKGDALDKAVQVRADLVAKLLDHDMPTDSLADLLDRIRRRQATLKADADSDEFGQGRPFLATIERDVKALMKKKVSAVVDNWSTPLEAALGLDPDASDREIARRVGCSPTTVAKARRRKAPKP